MVKSLFVIGSPSAAAAFVRSLLAFIPAFAATHAWAIDGTLGQSMSTPAALEIQLPAGTISGTHRQALRPVHEFLGIPYAAPPIGEMRWRAPQPVARWPGVREAKRFGPRCMQTANPQDTVRSTQMSEDCLYLNVWTPNKDERKKLPVLVHFHGGNLNEGDASAARYDGANIAARGIVAVTVNYRLGVFGFLALPAAWRESAHESAGNYGLLDQLAALRWVRDNISLFGGDPDQVTLAGDAGGAVAVSAHMASPQSRGLFARAIAQSGGAFGSLGVWSRARAEQLAARFATQVGASSLAQLRAMSAEQLVSTAWSGRDLKFAFWPYVDQHFLTDTPEAIFASGGQARVPLLLGNELHERDYGAVLSESEPTPENWKLMLARIFRERAAQAAAHYSGNDTEEVVRSAAMLASDLSVGYAVWQWMSMHRHAGATAPVYLYGFGPTRPLAAISSTERRQNARVPAGASVDYALANFDRYPDTGRDADERRAAHAFAMYVAHFVKRGNPNTPPDNPVNYFSALHLRFGTSLPWWPAVSEERGGFARQVIDAKPHSIWDLSAARYALVQQLLEDGAPDQDG